MSKNETAALGGNAKTAVCSPISGAVSSYIDRVHNIIDRLETVEQHLSENLARLGVYSPVPMSDISDTAESPGELGQLYSGISRLDDIVGILESHRTNIECI